MWVEALHAGLGWITASSLILLSFFTSLISIAFGLGGGLVMLAVLATVLPAPAVIPVHGLIQAGSNVGRSAVLLAHVHWPVLLPFALGSAIGVAVGGAVAVQLPPPVLQVLIGLFVLWSVFLRTPAFLRHSAAVIGAVSSALTMFVGGTGPFVAAYVKTLGLDRMSHVGTHASAMVLQHALKCAVFGILGFAFGSWLPLIVAMILAGFLGTVVGKAVLTRIDERLFRLILNGILSVLAIRLIAVGAWDLLAASGIGP